MAVSDAAFRHSFFEEGYVLFEEIAAIMRDPEQITFKAPDPRRIQRNLDSLEYERHRQREKKAKELAYQLRVILAEINDPELRKAILEKLGGQ